MEVEEYKMGEHIGVLLVLAGVSVLFSLKKKNKRA